MITKTYLYISKSTQQLPKKTAPYLYLDIETTGFQRDANIIYLIGCGFYEGDSLRIIQWLNDDGRSEEEILLSLSELLYKSSWTLLSFHGEGFDFPFLDHHFKEKDIPISMGNYASIDIYKMMKPFQKLFGLSHGRQKDWERFLGIHREDRYEGGELIRVYRNYLKKGEDASLHLLLLHNLEDIKGMDQLISLLPYRQVIEGDYQYEDMSYSEEAYGQSDGCLALSCRLKQPVPRPLRHSSDAGSLWVQGRLLQVSVPVYAEEMRHYYPDYKNYYYLPEEDRAIHKSIGCYVPKERRAKATAANCYIRREGIFLPLPPSMAFHGVRTDSAALAKQLTAYRRGGDEKTIYAIFDEVFSSGDADHKTRDLYIKNMVRDICCKYPAEG